MATEKSLPGKQGAPGMQPPSWAGLFSGAAAFEWPLQQGHPAHARVSNANKLTGSLDLCGAFLWSIIIVLPG